MRTLGELTMLAQILRRQAAVAVAEVLAAADDPPGIRRYRLRRIQESLDQTDSDYALLTECHIFKGD